MSKKDIIRFLILRTIGNFLGLFAIFGVLATFGPALYYEITFKVLQTRGVKYSAYEPKNTTSPLGEIVKQQKRINPAATVNTGNTFSDILAGPKEKILIPIDTSFDIFIPKIGANSKVFAIPIRPTPASFYRFFSRV
jgi:hypothetical protein